MSDKHIKIEKMWWSDKTPPAPLKALSHLYRLINRANLNARYRRCSTPPIPLISIGNLTVGGSGKTPFVIWLAGKLKHDGFKPVVICRGDGGKSGAPQIVSHDSDPLVVGDEALLLFQKCGCPVISGRDRIRAARMASEYGDIILLDDGFQYRQLKRICDIVLIPAEGIGNGHLIPAGPLREPVEALERADLIIRTGQSNAIKPLTAGREWRWWCRETTLTQLKGEKSEIPEQVVALTAIARPERFIQSLEQLGIRIEKSYLFPDHHPFSQADIMRAMSHKLPVVVTAKDAVKLSNIWPGECELWILEQTADAEAGLLEAIKENMAG